MIKQAEINTASSPYVAIKEDQGFSDIASSQVLSFLEPNVDNIDKATKDALALAL